MFVLCCVVRQKGKRQNARKSRQRTKYEVQTEYKRIKKIPMSARFSAVVQTGPRAHAPPIQRVPGLFPRGKSGQDVSLIHYLVPRLKTE
jgi:hypothetical protein